MLTSITNTNNITTRRLSFKESDAAKNLYEQIGQVDEEFKQKQAAQAQKISKRKNFIKNYKVLLIALFGMICAAGAYFARPFVISGENKKINELKNEIDSKKAELDVINDNLAERQNQLNILDSTYVTKTEELNQRDSIIREKEGEIERKKSQLLERGKRQDEKEIELSQKENELNRIDKELNRREAQLKTDKTVVSEQIAETKDVPPSSVKKVNKVLNTGEYGNLSDDAIISILNTQDGKWKYRTDGKNWQQQIQGPFGAYHWINISSPSKKCLLAGDVSFVKGGLCHQGDVVYIGRTIDGLFWAKNDCYVGSRGENLNIYTEDGRCISKTQRTGLYRDNILSTLQDVGNLSIMNCNMFAAVLASMNVFEIEYDNNKNCIYCKVNDGKGLRISYKINIDMNGIDGRIETFDSYDEARFSSTSGNPKQFKYKDLSDQLVCIFTFDDKDNVYKTFKNTVSKNGTVVLE